MTTRKATIDFILEQLSSLPDVRARKMFGDYTVLQMKKWSDSYAMMNFYKNNWKGKKA